MHPPARGDRRTGSPITLPVALAVLLPLAPGVAAAAWDAWDHDGGRQGERGYDRGGRGDHGWDHAYRDGRRGRYDHHDGYDRRGDRRHAGLPFPGIRVFLGDVSLYWDPVYLVPYGHFHGAYVPPRVGTRVRYLPAGYVSFLIGRTRYYGVGGTFYLWDPPRHVYVVVDKPLGAEEAMAAPGAEREDLFVYPAEGQDEDTQEWDRYACHEWAMAETAQGRGPVTPGTRARADYLRAVGACLEGRGYAVK